MRRMSSNYALKLVEDDRKLDLEKKNAAINDVDLFAISSNVFWRTYTVHITWYMSLDAYNQRQCSGWIKELADV